MGSKKRASQGYILLEATIWLVLSIGCRVRRCPWNNEKPYCFVSVLSAHALWKLHMGVSKHQEIVGLLSYGHSQKRTQKLWKQLFIHSYHPQSRKTSLHSSNPHENPPGKPSSPKQQSPGLPKLPCTAGVPGRLSDGPSNTTRQVKKSESSCHAGQRWEPKARQVRNVPEIIFGIPTSFRVWS